jgi:hypothetical protein
MQNRAYAPVLGRSRPLLTLRAQTSDHYVDADTRRGSGSSWGHLIAEGPAVLTLMCVEAALNRCPMCKVLWAVENPFSGYKDF